MNDKLILGVGLAQEIEHALNRNGFQSLEEVKALTVGDFLGRVRDVQRGLAEIKPVEHAIDCGVDAVIPSGYNWTVEEHHKGGIVKLERKGPDLYVDGKKIEFYLSKKQRKGSSIVGNDLRKELAKMPVLDANVLDYLLKNPHLIPEEWKKDEEGNTRYIFFWGTIYRRAGGGLFVRFLFWDDDRWLWLFFWLDSFWLSGHPAAVSAS
ncbi:MAG: hypothetical protein ABSF56_00885 [Minisyncoccia bacterium]|jgi:hypothetical protein